MGNRNTFLSKQRECTPLATHTMCGPHQRASVSARLPQLATSLPQPAGAISVISSLVIMLGYAYMAVFMVIQGLVYPIPV